MTLTVTWANPSGDGLACPQVAVTVTASPAVMSELALTRVHQDGSRWPVLGDRDPKIVTGYSVIDYHPPLNQQVTYEAKAAGLTGLSSPCTVYSDRAWLIHPSRPELSVSVVVTDASLDVKRDGEDGVDTHRPVGARLAVVRQWAPESGQSGQLQFWCATVDQTRALRALLRDGGLLLLAVPRSSWDDGVVDLGWMWVKLSAREWSVPAGRASAAGRLCTVGYTEVAAPDVDVVSPWDWAAVTESFASWAELTAAYESQAAFSLDVRTG